jgi:hypothetical protein
MKMEGDWAAESYETDPVSTDEQVWEDPDLSTPGETRPVIPDGVPESDALDQARPVPFDDDRSR